MKRYWIAVASAEHVGLGRRMGFMQVCHGKAGPLRRIRPGDGVVYYSPTERFGERLPLQAFTAAGTVLDGEPYQVEMSEGFHPFRRDVGWFESKDAPIAPLLSRLAFSAGRKSWGYQLRFGLFEISEDDFRLIADVMEAEMPETWKATSKITSKATLKKPLAPSLQQCFPL
jgi:hypothetical protein